MLIIYSIRNTITNDTGYYDLSAMWPHNASLGFSYKLIARDIHIELQLKVFAPLVL